MTAHSGKRDSSLRLSVVVVSILSHSRLRDCLDSILANERRDEIEIIVADCRSEESASDLIEKYPDVCFLRLPEKVGIPVLAAAGIARAAGEIIALTDSSCVVGSDWTAAILKAHRAPSPIVGGAVEVRGRMKLLDWAAYFCEYGQFAYPLKSGAMDALPGNNISFKRPALAVGSEYVKNEFWKTYWCRELRANGVELMAEPSIQVFYAKEFKLVPFLVRRFHHGRCFAGMRLNRLTILKRAFYAVGSIILPFVFLYRTVAVMLGKKRFLKKLFFSFPIIAAAIVFWSLGETCGYLAGKGKSCDYIY